MMTLFDFENADIGRLAVHIRECMAPRPARAYTVAASATDVIVGAGAGAWHGLALFNSSADTAATVSLYDGADTGGQLVATVAVPAAGSLVLMPTGPGVRFDRGLFVTGAADVSGSVFARFDRSPE